MALKAGSPRTVNRKWWLSAGKLIDAISYGLAYIAGGAGFGICLLIVYEIISRKVAGEGLSWTTEVSEFALVSMVYLGAAYAQLSKSHVAVDLVFNRLRPGARKIVLVLTMVISLALIGLFVWSSWNFAWLAYTGGYRSPSRDAFPLFPVRVLIPLGFALFFLQTAKTLYQSITQKGEPGKESVPAEKR